jgi:cytochrome c
MLELTTMRCRRLLTPFLCASLLAACDAPPKEQPAPNNSADVVQPVIASPASSVAVAPHVKPLTIPEGLALAQKNNCLACHSIDQKIVGPAWMDVSRRYKGVEGIEEKLVIKVSTGGYGNWGNIPMPALAPDVKEEDIRTLVRFVLSLAQNQPAQN